MCTHRAQASGRGMTSSWGRDIEVKRAVNNLFTPRASSGRRLVEARSAHIAPWRDQSRCPSFGRLSTRSTRSMATFQTRVRRVSAPLGCCEVPPTRFRGGPRHPHSPGPIGLSLVVDHARLAGAFACDVAPSSEMTTDLMRARGRGPGKVS